MRNWNVCAVTMAVAVLATVPVFGKTDSALDGASEIKNIRTGARNVSTGWLEVLDGINEAEGKSEQKLDYFTGAIAGAGIGTQKALHKTAAGAIELFTFWIPKHKPLLDPVKNSDN